MTWNCVEFCSPSLHLALALELVHYVPKLLLYIQINYEESGGTVSIAHCSFFGRFRMNSLLELSSTFVIVLANHSGTPMSNTRPPFAFLLTTCATHVSDFVSDDVLHWSTNISGNNHAFAAELNVSRATTSSSSNSTLSPTLNMLDSLFAPRKCPLGTATPQNSMTFVNSSEIPPLHRYLLSKAEDSQS